MKFTIIFSTFFSIASCDAAPQLTNHSAVSPVECAFSFENLNDCKFKTTAHELSIKLNTIKISSDELSINSLTVRFADITVNLSLTPGTTIIGRDVGYISFADINFDSIPDLAITTSFGTANLYLDYWIYNATQKNYTFVGNFPKLNPERNSKTLKATIKIDAAHYEKKIWVWKNDVLHEVKQ